MGERLWAAVGIGALGAACALAPVAPAAAASGGLRHSTAGSPSTHAACHDVQKEETGAQTVGLSVERALESGNFASAKQALLTAYGADEGNVSRALHAVRNAPPGVRSAFTYLLGFVGQIHGDIARASSLQELVRSFEKQGRNPRLVADGTVIEHWYESVCGKPPAATTSSGAS